MCKAETIRKIDAGTHIVVPKWLAIIRNIISPIVLIGFIFASGAWKESLNDKTFDTPQQKNKVIEFVKEGHPIDIYEEANMMNHINNKDIHRPTTGDMNMFIPRTELKVILEGIAKDIKHQNTLLIKLEAKIP